MAMRDVVHPQLEVGQVAIEEIDFTEHPRDHIPPMLRGIQRVYGDPSGLFGGCRGVP